MSTRYQPEPIVNSLTTIGEKSFHLICEYLRDTCEYKSIKSLCALMSTCKYCYFAVHNLPNIRMSEHYYTNYLYKSHNLRIISPNSFHMTMKRWKKKILPTVPFWRNAFSMLSLYGNDKMHLAKYIERIHETTGEAKFKDIDIHLPTLYCKEDFDKAYKLIELGCENLHICIPCKEGITSLNLHRFANVFELLLYRIKSLTDVSMLGNVKVLDISGTQVSDVSMLGNVKVLNISSTHVSDVSMLGNVKVLNICNTQVSDVSMLGNVHTLELNGCMNITDFSKLGNVTNLFLASTNFKDSDVKYLTNNVYVELQGLPITDLTPLGFNRLYKLNVCFCEITKYNLENMRKLHTLVINSPFISEPSYSQSYKLAFEELKDSNVIVY